MEAVVLPGSRMPVDNALRSTVLVAPPQQAMAREPRPKPRPFCNSEAEALAWAAKWWAEYEPQVKQDNGRLYIYSNPLLEQLDWSETQTTYPFHSICFSLSC